ncbi:MAG: tRNA (N6-isopentenyl adenosine(37)-C2)-methylthiotransferase MiaB [Bacteroidales bacterium]|nr:tRNA (N6-isopentenyl adenosine(37)-C2)-methylthiotransferase MiaB [Lentimicrobiaceae bacterium]MDD5694343.1 tRNA (N6-isopentenyl adenosine(37)-C2)-methylthiotransferase MiaB [Bacteroidales bacterium]
MSQKKKLYIETYGCQMNFSDSEIVGSLMLGSGYEMTNDPGGADVIFINTCSIREHAEQRVRRRLKELSVWKKKRPSLVIGVLGCMAERLRESFMEEEPLIDMLIGPDAYRHIPELLQSVGSGQRAVDVLLSMEETYADIRPVRLASNRVSAFLSIMRGCGNFCAYCVVPFTRGTERSRDPESIIREVTDLVEQGYREVTLLGQNVNSYTWKENDRILNFPRLLERVAEVDQHLRIRFATSHPKDLSDELISLIASSRNVCRSIHLPVQSGSNPVLKRMNRKYTREWYMDRIRMIRKHIPDGSISTDIIAGFCGETEEDHQQTLSLMKEAAFDFAFMFKYSERPGTPAAEKFRDDVPEAVKSRRLNEIIQLQQNLSLQSNQKDRGKIFEVLVEGRSRKSAHQLSGRNSQNKVIVFPALHFLPGNLVKVTVTGCTSATLMGEVVTEQESSG